MAGDLEEFLRRAAEKRRKAMEAVREDAGTPTHKHTAASERVIRAEEIEPVDVVEAMPVDPRPGRSQQPSPRRVPAPATRRTPAQSTGRVQAPRPSPPPAGPAPPAAVPPTPAAAVPGPPISDRPTVVADNLLDRLRSPGGLREAMLLREILDRPTHRW